MLIDNDQRDLDRQFNYVRMSKGSHVFKLSSNTGFGLLTKNNSLGYVFHGNSVTRNRMFGH